MLKNKLTQEQYDALDEGVKGYYSQKGTEWFLQTDESGNLERALKSERRNHDQTTKLLAQIVPGIVDESSSTGYIDRKKWREEVDSRGDLLEDLGDDFDPDAFRRFVDSDDPKDSDGESVAAQLRDAKEKLRKSERDNKRMSKEIQDAKDELAEVRAAESTLVIDRDLNRTLDEINVRHPTKRRLTRALFQQELGMKVVDGVTVVVVDGDEVPLSEYGTEWAATADGKEMVNAPDNSGGAHRKVQVGTAGKKSGGDEMTAEQKLASAFDSSKK